MMNVCVIGKGLAGIGVVLSLIEHEKVTTINWIGPDPLNLEWKSCSRESTALVSLQGIKKGVSPLGDDLYDAFFEMENFIKEQNPAGVTSANRFHLSRKDPRLDDEEKYKQRFDKLDEFNLNGHSYTGIIEKSYVINPESFLSSLILHCKACPKVNMIDDIIVGYEKDVAKAASGNYQFDKLIYCAGALGLSFLDGYADIGKHVVGHYYRWDNIENFPLFSESTVLTIGGHNLIYNKDYSYVTLGGSTLVNFPYTPETIDLDLMLDMFTREIPILKEFFESKRPQILTGVRVKGKKRMPVVKEIDPNVLVVNGFYKNGYTLFLSMGKRVSKMI